MKSDLDVWAIQKHKDEMFTALKNIKKNSLGNILYLNCHCKFKIGDKKITNRTFDACFYSEDSDVVILFARRMVSEEEIVKCLEKENIKYTTIRFSRHDDELDYISDESIPDIWFVREKCVLEEAIEDCINKGDIECEYFPDIKSSLHLNYLANDGESYEFEGRICEGLLLFEEKMVIFVSQRDPRNLKEKEINEILKEKGIKVKKQKNRR